MNKHGLTVTQQNILQALDNGAYILKARRSDKYELWKDGVYQKAVLKTTFDALSNAGYLRKDTPNKYVRK